jgi:hypothetical protein
MDLHRQTSLAIRLLQLGIFLLLTIWIFGWTNFLVVEFFCSGFRS